MGTLVGGAVVLLGLDRDRCDLLAIGRLCGVEPDPDMVLVHRGSRLADSGTTSSASPLVDRHDLVVVVVRRGLRRGISRSVAVSVVKIHSAASRGAGRVAIACGLAQLRRWFAANSSRSRGDGSGHSAVSGVARTSRPGAIGSRNVWELTRRAVEFGHVHYHPLADSGCRCARSFRRGSRATSK